MRSESESISDVKGLGDQGKRVSVVIPAFNEADNIAHVIRDILALHPDAEVLVIDDGSSDETAERAQGAGATVYRHAYNIGNGAAVKTGIRVASGDVLVFMDGDGQHDPLDIQRLLNHIPKYDLVVGERPKGGQASFFRALGNWIYNRFASYVAKFTIRDLTSGFRAIKADIAREFIFLLPNTYSYPTTITLGVLRSGRSVRYQKINIRRRLGGKSGIRIMSDGIRFFMIITKICTLYSPFRIFLPVSFLLFLLGVFYYGFTFVTAGRFTNMSQLLISTSVIIFMMGLVSEQICQLRFERRTAFRKSDHVKVTGDTAETEARDPAESKRALENRSIPERRMHS
jgi:glycosyltransferase involved in cell wall biosynthesis